MQIIGLLIAVPSTPVMEAILVATPHIFALHLLAPPPMLAPFFPAFLTALSIPAPSRSAVHANAVPPAVRSGLRPARPSRQSQEENQGDHCGFHLMVS